MKEFALVCWIASVGFVAGLFADQQCFRSNAEQSAIERANAAGRESLRLRDENLQLKTEADALRRTATAPDQPPAGERIPAVSPPLPTH